MGVQSSTPADPTGQVTTTTPTDLDDSYGCMTNARDMGLMFVRRKINLEV